MHTHTHTHAHSNSTRTRPVPQRRPEPRVLACAHPPINRTPTAAAAAATAHIRGVIQQQHLSHERTVRTRSTATAAAAKFPYAATTRTEQSLSSFWLHHARVRCMHRLVTKTLRHSSEAATRTEQTQIHNQPTHRRVESIHLSPHMQPNFFGRNRDSRAARARRRMQHPHRMTIMQMLQPYVCCSHSGCGSTGTHRHGSAASRSKQHRVCTGTGRP
jgi:hypothetical protein